jgi:DNA-binding CsgD family transcriptional regulator
VRDGELHGSGSFQHRRRRGLAVMNTKLSARQVEVLTHYGKGMTPTAIGHLIGLSIKTVSSHLTWAQDKLNLDTREELRRYAEGMIADVGIES